MNTRSQHLIVCGHLSMSLAIELAQPDISCVVVERRIAKPFSDATAVALHRRNGETWLERIWFLLLRHSAGVFDRTAAFYKETCLTPTFDFDFQNIAGIYGS